MRVTWGAYSITNHGDRFRVGVVDGYFISAEQPRRIMRWWEARIEEA